jgi:hypothetical protein
MILPLKLVYILSGIEIREEGKKKMTVITQDTAYFDLSIRTVKSRNSVPINILS